MDTTTEHTSLISLVSTLIATNAAIGFTVLQYGLVG
jgi:hypothetical protein